MSDLKVLAEQLRAAGYKVYDPPAATEKELWDKYRTGAKAQQREGELEVDDDAVVSLGDDAGAYVQAWVWVSNSDAGLPCCTDCEASVAEDDPYSATPCGTYCVDCMSSHMAECEICRKEFSCACR